MRIQFAALLVGGLIASGPNVGAAEALPLIDRLKDAHATGVDFWVYNDIDKARAEARRLNKPIFVTFRCVPCKNCASFDAEVAKNNEVIQKLARSKFISVRQVEMKGVDLSQFQFDFDLNWAAMFINADGTIYGRYGTQSEKGPDAYNSIDSLEKAMQRVLELHAAYPANKAALQAKLPAPKPYKTALEMPGLDRKETLRGQTERGNCIHCHNVHDAENRQWVTEGTFSHDRLWRYPLPDNTGFHVDPKDGVRIESVQNGSPSDRAGLRAGDEVTHVNGQAIISIADIQWVLNQLPNDKASFEVTLKRAGNSQKATVKLERGWKQTDISWRGSMWSLRPRPGFWAPAMKPEEIAALNLPAGVKPMKVQFFANNAADGDAVKKSGLRAGDIVTEFEGKPFTMTPLEFNVHVRLNYKIGDTLKLGVFRDGKTVPIQIPLVSEK